MHSPTYCRQSHATPHGSALVTALLVIFSTASWTGCVDDVAPPALELSETVSALSSPWIAAFGYNAGGWRVERHPRMTGDVNGDGKDDVVGFADDGVYVSISTGYSLRSPTRWIANFGYSAGSWRVDRHPRMMADVNGDGKDDVVGFAEDGVYVSTSTGFSFNPMVLWSPSWYYNAWGGYPRVMADVNGDGRADVIGFGYNYIGVSLSTGAGFDSIRAWRWYDFTTVYGWDLNQPRMVADVNGDGRGDVVGFGNYGVEVATASTISNEFVFNSPPRWLGEFGSYAGWWSVARHPRMTGDVNGDGRQDIIGFSDDGPYVSLSTGTGFTPSGLWAYEFGYNVGGWRVEYHPRVMGDMNGDGRQDVVGFAENGTYVALSTGSSFLP